MISLSIVTPSYNQAEFLEEAIRSVLDQNYPSLEYVIADGGSVDGSVEIIRRYADRLTHWTSAKDNGQYDAIVRAFGHTSGEVMGWINSDDKYTPWCFSVIAEIFSAHPEIEWLTTAYPLKWDRRGRATGCVYVGGFNGAMFMNGSNLPRGRWHVGSFIQQESTFWRRRLWDRTGAYIDNDSIAGDFELWTRFFRHTSLYAVATPLGGFRAYGDQISVRRYTEYLDAAESVLRKAGGGRQMAARRLLRWTLHRAFGGRPLDKLPRSLATPLQYIGMLHAGTEIHWDGSRWVKRESRFF